MEGEQQILCQLKSANAVAKEHGSVSGFLDLVMTRAFNVAKRVRSETEIGESAVSVSYAAVELAREIFGNLQGKRVLVIGAGKMAESAARHLRPAGWLILEHGSTQAETVAQLLVRHGFANIRSHADYAGKPRITLGSVHSSS